MAFNKSDFPYLFESRGEAQTLPNGVVQRISWEYSLNQASVNMTILEDDRPLIIERVWRKQSYRFAGYHFVASAVDAWQYLDVPDVPYAEMMQGYRGYWEGEVYYEDKPALQPELAIFLAFTPDMPHIPPYIETLTEAELNAFLTQASERYANDDALAFQKPLPIEADRGAPDSIKDAMRRMRAQSHLVTTRGRAALLEYATQMTGVEAVNGGWRLQPDEHLRRKSLGLHNHD